VSQSIYSVQEVGAMWEGSRVSFHTKPILRKSKRISCTCTLCII